MSDIFNVLDDLLKNTDLEDVTADSNIFSELPDGYYLCNLEKGELKETKETHFPMVSMQFKIVEDGKKLNEDGDIIDIPKVKNRKIFINYVLKDETSVKRFVTDMLKFEGETPDKPVLEKEYFTNSEVLEEALKVLEGFSIYIQSSTTENKDGTNSNWKNLISWKRVRMLKLPE